MLVDTRGQCCAIDQSWTKTISNCYKFFVHHPTLSEFDYFSCLCADSVKKLSIKLILTWKRIEKRKIHYSARSFITQSLRRLYIIQDLIVIAEKLLISRLPASSGVYLYYAVINHALSSVMRISRRTHTHTHTRYLMPALRRFKGNGHGSGL